MCSYLRNRNYGRISLDYPDSVRWQHFTQITFNIPLGDQTIVSAIVWSPNESRYLVVVLRRKYLSIATSLCFLHLRYCLYFYRHSFFLVSSPNISVMQSLLVYCRFVTVYCYMCMCVRASVCVCACVRVCFVK